jgi:hypothetical protein
VKLPALPIMLDANLQNTTGSAGIGIPLSMA